MSVYMTEEEQIEAIKAWWKRHSTIIMVVFSTVLIIFSAYRYWTWHQDKIHQQASATYEHLMLAFSNHDNKAVRGYAKQLIHDYDNTVYASVARLTLAKLFVARGNYPRATELLDEVVAQSKITALQQVANMRKARLLIAQQSYDKALQTLTRVDDAGYSSVVNELKGDVYVATGHKQDALNCYKKAISDVQQLGIVNPFLDMKASQLAALDIKSSSTRAVV